MNRMILALSVFIACMLIVPGGVMAALQTSVTQSGADNDEVMKGRTFTVSASGWTGDCSTATISFSGCSSCSLSGEETVKTVGSGSTSVSWTTVSASQSASAQTITISLSGGCTLQEDSSDQFNIVLPPSLSLTASSGASQITQGSSYVVNINLANNGETTANDISFSVSGTGMSLSSGCSSISSLDEDQNAAQTCTIAGNTAGTITTTITASSTNADSSSDSFSIVVEGTGGENPPGGPGGGPTGGPSGGVVDDDDETTGEGNVTRRRARFQFGPPGIVGNEKLQAAIRKVLNISQMSEQARANLEELSNAISSGSEFHKEMASGNGKTDFRLTYRYTGQEMVRNLMIYEKIPKTIAASSSAITVDAGEAEVELVETDPEYLFTFQEVYPDEELNITYTVNTELGTTLLDDTETEIYGESLEEFEKECETPGERACRDGNVYQCTDQYGWSLVQTCGYGCEDGECLPRTVTPIDLSAFLVPVVSIIIVIVIIAGLVLFKKSGKKLKRRKGIGGKIKSPPHFAPKHYK